MISAYFIAWSIGLSVGYFVMYSPLLQAAQHADGLELGATKRVAVGVNITLTSAVLLLCFGGLHIFGLAAVYRYLDSQNPYDAWRWYGFHTGTRVAELLLATLLAVVASLMVWTRAARRSSTTITTTSTIAQGNTASRGLSLQTGNSLEDRRQQQLLMQGRMTPSSPARNRRDFPVTFNPEGVKADDEFFRGDFRIAHGNRSVNCWREILFTGEDRMTVRSIH